MASLISLPSVQTGHIGLNVSDLARSKQFYQQVFGFEVLGESHEEGRQFVFLGQDSTPVLTLWQQSEGRFGAHSPGLHHLAFQVGTIEAVRTFEGRLHALGAPFLYDRVVPHAEGADSGGVYFEDPDGIRLEIYSPNGASGLAAPTVDAPSCGFF
ncbi:MAG TPA: VOC family protein [Roseiflexaceae bacterium]|nr:VOC family protein [Roseiflexaceae bacterium]